MEQLVRAEKLDSYHNRCRQSPLNAAARAGLSYTPFFQEPSAGPAQTLLITMHPTAEGGLPHTRPPNLICIPAYYPESQYAEMIRHELVHIDQRRRPGIWRDKFVREGWTPLPEGLNSFPADIQRRIRLNPDTLDDGFWAWQGRWVPLPLFEREDKPSLRETATRWYDLTTGSLLPQPPASFSQKYGSQHPQAEHPREVVAVLLAESNRSPDEYLASY